MRIFFSSQKNVNRLRKNIFSQEGKMSCVRFFQLLGNQEVPQSPARGQAFAPTGGPMGAVK